MQRSHGDGMDEHPSQSEALVWATIARTMLLQLCETLVLKSADAAK